MSESLVSIITATYNSSDYIRDTYLSICSQSHANWEWLVTDDASIDGTWRILCELAEADARIRVQRLHENQGAGVARNLSLRLAKGEFIAFLDSDDLWNSMKLERQIDFMGCEVPFSFTAYQIVDQDGLFTGQTVDSSNAGSFSYSDLLRKKATVGCSTVMLNSSIVGSVSMPSLRSGQDYATWLNIARGGLDAVILPEVLTSYRVRSGSISRNKVKKAAQQWRIYRRVEKLGLFVAAICFSFYAYNAVFRRK